MNAMHLLEAMTNIDGALIENAAVKPRRSGRTLARILLVAALIAALAMTVVAAKEFQNWFQDYFEKLSPQPLSENQITFIDAHTTDLTQSQTCNGYTIAVDSAFTDGSMSIVRLKLIAPEDIKLDAVNYFPGNDGVFTPVGEDRDSWNGGWGLYVDDAQPNVGEITCYIREDIGDRTHWKMRIEDIYGTFEENVGEADYRQWTEVVVEGTWEFDITFAGSKQKELELINKPIPGKVNIALNKDAYKDVRITSLKLRAMSAEITYEYLEPIHGAGEFDAIYVVMKDGSKAMLLPRSGSPGRLTYEFATPIILEDADHVLLPDGTKLPIP